jgi:hypothetical protein
MKGGRHLVGTGNIRSWALIDRESNGRFVASIPDLSGLAGNGDTDSVLWLR